MGTHIPYACAEVVLKLVNFIFRWRRNFHIRFTFGICFPSLINIRIIGHILISTLIPIRLHWAHISFSSSLIKVGKFIASHICLLSCLTTASITAAEVLSQRKIEAMRQLCKEDRDLWPILDNKILPCRDFELYLHLKDLKRDQEAGFLLLTQEQAKRALR